MICLLDLGVLDCCPPYAEDFLPQVLLLDASRCRPLRFCSDCDQCLFTRTSRDEVTWPTFTVSLGINSPWRHVAWGARHPLPRVSFLKNRAAGHLSRP